MDDNDDVEPMDDSPSLPSTPQKQTKPSNTPRAIEHKPLQLEHVTPLNNPPNRAQWTAKQEEEDLRRQKEAERIKGWDARIEKQQMLIAKESRKLDRLQFDRNQEVLRYNKRRAKYDSRITRTTRIKKSGQQIRNRRVVEVVRKRVHEEGGETLVDDLNKSVQFNNIKQN